MQSEEPIRSLHELLEKSYSLQCSSSTYEYLDVLDENADSHDTMILPAHILEDLKQGGFSVSITRRPWHSSEAGRVQC